MKSCPSRGDVSDAFASFLMQRGRKYGGRLGTEGEKVK